MKSKKPRPPTRVADSHILAVSEFKARCLEVLEGLRGSGRELVLTKHGTPIARVVPISSQPLPLRGLLKGEIEIVGDLVHADFSADWEANR